MLLAAICVFFMFSAYSVLRPIRETMGITSGVSTLPALFWGTFVVMLAVQPVYGWLTSRFRRSAFLPWVYLFFVLNILGFYVWFNAQADHTWIARVYFVWLSVFNLFVVAVFWSLMADVFNREQAGRLFGFIAAGISLGGLAGPVPRSAPGRAPGHHQPAADLGGTPRALAAADGRRAALAASDRRGGAGRHRQPIPTRSSAAIRLPPSCSCCARPISR